MRKTALLLAFSLLLSTAAAYAEGISYNYGDVSYKWEYSNEEEIGNSNGVEANLSLSPMEYLALEGKYEFASFKTDGFKTRVNAWRYGALGYLPICPNYHALARVGGVSDNVHINEVGSENVNGVYAGGGLRYMFENDAEVEGNITYSHVKYGTANWEYEGTGLYPLVGGLALKGTAGIDDDSNVSLLAGLRYSF